MPGILLLLCALAWGQPPGRPQAAVAARNAVWFTARSQQSGHVL